MRLEVKSDLLGSSDLILSKNNTMIRRTSSYYSNFILILSKNEYKRGCISIPSSRNVQSCPASGKVSQSFTWPHFSLDSSVVKSLLLRNCSHRKLSASTALCSVTIVAYQQHILWEDLSFMLSSQSCFFHPIQTSSVLCLTALSICDKHNVLIQA